MTKKHGYVMRIAMIWLVVQLYPCSILCWLGGAEIHYLAGCWVLTHAQRLEHSSVARPPCW